MQLTVNNIADRYYIYEFSNNGLAENSGLLGITKSTSGETLNEAKPHLIALSKRMMTMIKCNLTFSMGLNFVAILLAIRGTLNPVVGALVHNAGSVLVIINSAFLLKWRKRK